MGGRGRPLRVPGLRALLRRRARGNMGDARGAREDSGGARHGRDYAQERMPAPRGRTARHQREGELRLLLPRRRDETLQNLQGPPAPVPHVPLLALDALRQARMGLLRGLLPWHGARKTISAGACTEILRASEGAGIVILKNLTQRHAKEFLY